MGLKNGRAVNGFWKLWRAQFNELKSRVHSPTEFWLALHIWDACTGGPEDIDWLPLTDDELIKIARGVTRQAVSRAVRRMVKLGWIVRRRADADRRSWEYGIRPDKFTNGPVWAAHTCSPRASVSPPDTSNRLVINPVQQTVGNGMSTLQNSHVECTYGPDCPYLLKTLKTNTSSSSSEEPATTTEGANAPAAPDAAPAGPPEPEPRIEQPAPDRRDTPRASVRPSDRTERRRAVSRPPQQHTDNGGDRRDGGRKPGDDSLKKPEFRNLDGAAETCPPVVAGAMQKFAPGCDQHVLDTTWQWSRKARRDIEPDEVVQLIRQAGPRVLANRATRSAPLCLREAVVALVATPSAVDVVRSLLAAERERAAAAQAQLEREMRAWYAETNDEAERERMRAIHPFLRE